MGKDAMIRTVRGGGTLRQPVCLHPHEEVGTKIMRGALEFIDVAFPVAYVYAAFGRANKRDGLAQILQPAVTLLRLDRHARRIDVPTIAS